MLNTKQFIQIKFIFYYLTSFIKHIGNCSLSFVIVLRIFIKLYLINKRRFISILIYAIARVLISLIEKNFNK